jgi:hypothetical protein
MHSRLLIIVLFFALVMVFGSGSSRAQPEGSTIYLPLLRSIGLIQTGVSNNLNVYSATHLGGPAADTAAAVDIAPDGTVVLGGTLPDFPSSVTPTSLLNGTSGALLRFDSTGQTLLTYTQLGASVNDLEISPSGAIIACGDFGLAALTPAADALLWSVAPGNGQRCAVGADGTAAVLVGATVFVYAADGAPLGSWDVSGSARNDIAVAGAQQLVIVTGYTQVSRDLQLPFLRGYSYSGELRWRSYDTSSAPTNLGADTRGERVAIGRDGRLYLTGSINGGTGASVFSRDPKDINLSVNDRTVRTDRFTDPFNVGSVSMLWFGRFNPADGTLELAQSVLTRLSSGRGNSISGQAIMADADGTVYIGGMAFASIANRDTITINGQPTGGYSSGDGAADAYVLVVSPDFRQRQHWVVFAAPGGGRGCVSGISVRNGQAALAATLRGGAFITQNALQPTPGGDRDAYLATWE